MIEHVQCSKTTQTTEEGSQHGAGNHTYGLRKDALRHDGLENTMLNLDTISSTEELPSLSLSNQFVIISPVTKYGTWDDSIILLSKGNLFEAMCIVPCSC